MVWTGLNVQELHFICEWGIVRKKLTDVTAVAGEAALAFTAVGSAGISNVCAHTAILARSEVAWVVLCDTKQTKRPNENNKILNNL